MIDRPSVTAGNGRAFNEWMRAQLRTRHISEQELAEASGLDAARVAELVRDAAMPTLDEATKIARALRIVEPEEAPFDAAAMAARTENPTARVEYSLRADMALAEPQVRQVMEYYIAVRLRRLARVGADPTQPRPLGRPVTSWEGYDRLPPAVAAAFRAEPNALSRRRLVEVFGIDRYTQAVGEVTDEVVDGAGRPRRLWRALRPGDVHLRVVEVTNATPEPDGSYARHWLRVPPETSTAREAVAWTFGLDADRYQELIET